MPKIIIDTQPKGLERFVNQITNLPAFSVSASSIKDANLTYQWYSSTVASGSNKNWQKISGATNSTYTVPVDDVKTVGSKYYFVQIGGTINGAKLQPVSSFSVSLTINALPKIIISNEPKKSEAFVGQAADLPTLSVVASSVNGSNLSYQWYKSNTISNKDWTLISGANSSSYKIPASDIKTIGSKYYYVKISGVFNGLLLTSVDSNATKLTVNLPPAINITTQPQNAKVYANQVSNLPTFSVDGTTINPNEELTYQWYSNNIESTSRGKVIQSATNKTYQVRKSDFKNIMKVFFYVKISGTINGSLLTPVYSKVATLTVENLPTITITTQPKNWVYYFDKPNEIVPVFKVLAKANNLNAKLKYQWYRNGNINEPSTIAKIIPGANGPSYVVLNSDLYVQPGIMLQVAYYCIISGNFEGINLQSVKSNNAYLTIFNYQTDSGN